MKPFRLLALVLAAIVWPPQAARAATPTKAPSPVLQGLDALYPELDALYQDLHQHPELSQQEENTAAKLAERLRKLGYEVTENVGGHGVVALLRNGKGPTVLVRTDLDALPVEEKTGLPYASRVTAKDSSGQTVPVMHACGHDVHMTSWLGTAALLARSKDRWRGTVMFVGQPAEEQGSGARKMLQDGLYNRFPRPQFAIAIHNSATAPSGSIEYVSGYALANVDSVDVTLYGKGGHGAYPHTTVDPIVLAARTILSLQTIVSREKSPLEPGVITVGSIHGGTKHNIIPNEVKMQLTVRSYSKETRDKLLDGIRRIARGEAIAAGLPEELMPEVKPFGTYAEATFNNEALTGRLADAFTRRFGADRVERIKPLMVSEDFGQYRLADPDHIQSVMFHVGGVPQAKWDAAGGDPAKLPSLHSAVWAPDAERVIQTGAEAMVTAALDVLGKKDRPD